MDNNIPTDPQGQDPTELQSKIAELEAAKRAAEEAAAAERAAKEGLVAELKELRTKKTDLEPPKPATEDIDAKIRAALEEKERQDASRSKEVALERFKAEHKDFHPDNDPGGLKFAALLKEFESFDTSGARSVEDFSSYLQKSLRLIAPAKGSEAETVTDEPPAPAKSGEPKATPASKLTAREREVISQLGWTEERFLDLKTKNPDYVKSVLA